MMYWMLSFFFVFFKYPEGKCCSQETECRVWSDRSITIKTKVDIYQTCVLISLHYSSETWITYWSHIKWLERYHQKCPKHTISIKWQSLLPDTVVIQRSKYKSTESMIILNHKHWVGHVRMKANRLPKQLFYRDLKIGKCPQCKPRKRFNYNLK